MKKIILFLLYITFMTNSYSQETYFSVTSENVIINNDILKCDIKIQTLPGWKIATTPSIYIKEYQNINNIEFEQHEGKINTYVITLKGKILDTSKNISKIHIVIQCPMCKDICTFAHKQVIISFNHTQKTHTFNIINDNKEPKNNNINLKISDTSKNKHSNHNILYFIILAIIGGLILNATPCVLPVLLIKLKSITESNKKTALMGAIIGNYTTFLALTIFFMFLRTAGESIGWGMHFQNLSFLKFATIILFLFTLYSFEITKLSPSIQLSDNTHNIFAKNFVSSVIASIMSIPCTAPALGTAAAFAIQGSIVDLMLIFFAIATGFSIPYFTALLIPSLNIFSKWSRYSNVIKKILNVGVLITFIWIMFLLSNHITIEMLLIYNLIFLICALLFHNNLSIHALILLAILYVIPISDNTHLHTSTMINKNNIWEKYTDMSEIRAIISNATKNNQLVILTISADWCLNCQYNKIITFNNKKISDFIRTQNVLCLEGDITKTNDGIMRYIKEHNRIGIPFSIIYGPKATAGILLSEFPSTEEIITALHQAK